MAQALYERARQRALALPGCAWGDLELNERQLAVIGRIEELLWADGYQTEHGRHSLLYRREPQGVKVRLLRRAA